MASDFPDAVFSPKSADLLGREADILVLAGLDEASRRKKQSI
jgi:predicted Holliday junction resolvase-like endonuclease